MPAGKLEARRQAGRTWFDTEEAHAPYLGKAVLFFEDKGRRERIPRGSGFYPLVAPHLLDDLLVEPAAAARRRDRQVGRTVGPGKEVLEGGGHGVGEGEDPEDDANPKHDADCREQGSLHPGSQVPEAETREAPELHAFPASRH